MNAYERLMAEAIPTGRFGYPPPPSDPHKRPWTALEQAEHLRVLDEALDGWQSTEERATRDRERPRPLRLVPACDPDTGSHPDRPTHPQPNHTERRPA